MTYDVSDAPCEDDIVEKVIAKQTAQTMHRITGVRANDPNTRFD